MNSGARVDDPPSIFGVHPGRTCLDGELKREVHDVGVAVPTCVADLLDLPAHDLSFLHPVLSVPGMRFFYIQYITNKTGCQ